MKTLSKNVYLSVMTTLLVITSSSAHASMQDTGGQPNPLDSVEISLLTCEPYNKVYSLYGHTAIRINDMVSGEDLAVNYGVFDSSAKNFTLRFIFGLTDYEVGIYPFDIFCHEYERAGRYVKEQVLDLTASEKQKIIQDIAVNSLQENKVYRYNIFYNNCTTRARDVILDNIDGEIVFAESENHPSFRQMVHKYTKGHRWSAFGNDILLGLKADAETTNFEQQFLPERLLAAFSTAMRARDSNTQTPLVKVTRVIVPSAEKEADNSFPLTPTHVGLIILAVVIALTIAEQRRKTYFAALDATIYLVCGAIGILLTMMIFSQHPTVQVNLQLLLFNPLPLLFGWQAIRRRQKGKSHWMTTAWIYMIFLFFIGRYLQTYAEGTEYIAFAVAIRLLTSRHVLRKNKLKNAGK